LAKILESQFSETGKRITFGESHSALEKDLDEKNKQLKRAYRNYLNHMGEMIEKRARGISEISAKQIDLEIKLV